MKEKKKTGKDPDIYKTVGYGREAVGIKYLEEMKTGSLFGGGGVGGRVGSQGMTFDFFIFPQNKFQMD